MLANGARKLIRKGRLAGGQLHPFSTGSGASRETRITDLGPDGFLSDDNDEVYNVVRKSSSQADNMKDAFIRDIFQSQHDLFRALVRHFFETQVKPHHAQWEMDGQVHRDCWQKAGALGLLGVDTSLDGKGNYQVDFLDSIVMVEEQAYANTSGPGFMTHSSIVMPLIDHHGTPEQKADLQHLKLGDKIGAIAMYESESGCDLSVIKTQAKRDGDDWVLNGTKYNVINGYLSDLIIVLAVTDPNAGMFTHGQSLFLVDAGTSGVTKGRRINRIGLRAQDTIEMEFDNVRLPSSALLGMENYGFLHILTQLPRERLLLGAYCTAMSEGMFETTREYVRTHRTGGTTLISMPAVQHKMADLKTEICVTRAFTDQCIYMHTRKELDSFTASMLKFKTSELANRTAYECLQLYGGKGDSEDCPLSKAYVDARTLSLQGGPNQLMKELVGRNIAKGSDGA